MYKEDKTFTILLALCLSLLPVVATAATAAESAIMTFTATAAESATTTFTATAANEPSATAGEELYLSVDDVIERVNSHNLQLMIREESVRRALSRIYQRRAALLPQFSLRAEQNRQQLARGFAAESIETPPFNSFTSRVEASLSVFDTQRYADFQIARLDHAIAQNDYEVAVQDFLEQAIFIYFTQLRDLRSVEIAEENLARERRLLSLARQQYEAGAAVKIDVTRAEVRVATERRVLMEALTAVQESIFELKVLLDFDLDRRIELDPSIVEEAAEPALSDFDGSPEMLIELRPELLSQEQVIRQARLARKAAGWQRLPSVELFADWGYESQRPFDDEEGEAWLIGIRARMPIWEGGRIAAEKREASAALRQNEYAMRDLRNQIASEYKFSVIEMDSRFAQIGIADDEVRLGQDEVEQALERYREGLADNRELIDAQKRLAEAERSRLSAIYLYGLSRLDFVRSLGAVELIAD